MRGWHMATMVNVRSPELMRTDVWKEGYKYGRDLKAKKFEGDVRFVLNWAKLNKKAVQS